VSVFRDPELNNGHGKRTRAMVLCYTFQMSFDLSIFQEAVRICEEERKDAFSSFRGSSAALLFAMLKDPCLLICSSESSAAEFYADTLFWSRLLNSNPPVLIHPEGSLERPKSLTKLYEQDKRKYIASVDASLSQIWFKEDFPTITITRGLILDRDEIVHNFLKNGYVTVPMVSGAGELSMRGGILDIFPPDKEQPVRIEFFGDEVESLRYFSIDTQLSDIEINDILVTPAIEPDEGPTLIDFLSENRLIFNEPDDIRRRYPELSEACGEKKPVSFTSLSLEAEGFNSDINGVAGFGLLLDERKTIDDFVERVHELAHRYFILMICSSEGQAKRLKDLFFELERDVPVLTGGAALMYDRSPVIVIGELSGGFAGQDSIVLAAGDIFGKRPGYKSIKKSKVSKLISSIEDFKDGDYLVHVEHGIGQFLGLKKERIEGWEGDFLIVEYLGGDKLFVPLEQIDHVQKYNAPEGVSPRVDKLGGKTWQKTKRRVKQKIKDMAERLIKIYAGRTTAVGNAFSEDTELHKEFDGFFPYEETPDQLTSINDIKRDMEQPLPMDRLLCGDVGYGKTEVVIRACFKAVFDSRQVAVLVPTTILAEQHYETFVSRFSAFPIKIDFLSRFKNRAEIKQTLKDLSTGDIDIIIGTHKLLSKDIQYFNLGLLVIDEEHKFGVTHKEKIKAFKSNVDVLTLSATPIPRTLHMALSGIRGMSTIETPPEARMAVKSKVARFNPETIREAIQFEIDRSGQVFFVHNRVHDIYKMANFLRGLVPEGKIGVAHGQMKGKELEHVMHKFFHNEINILVSTSIISSGLDIPSANTIIINRADRFGLADLYQMRGRVGRSNIKAYAYFLIPGEDIISEDARKKLQAIQEMGYLGAGFRLALKDLEIRGAGNLLGSEQSGHIEAIGFDMYMEMLGTAVAELKGEKTAPSIEPIVDLKTSAVIPEEYIEDPDLRLSAYRKIVSAKDINSINGLFKELKDRFGEPPERTKKLIDIMEIKVLAKDLYITKVINTSGRVSMLFAPETPVRPEKIFMLYENRQEFIKFLPEGGIELDLRGRKWNETINEIKGVIEELKSSGAD